MIDGNDMRNILRHRLEAAGSKSEWAADNGFTITFIDYVLKGKRGMTKRLAKSLGYNRIVAFSACKDDGND
jgi:hypothetical protein